MGVTYHLLSTDVFYFSKDLKMCYAFMHNALWTFYALN